MKTTGSLVDIVNSHETKSVCLPLVGLSISVNLQVFQSVHSKGLTD